MLVMLPVVVMRHVAEAIEMHERRHRIDHNQHDRGQTVHPDRPFRAQAAAFDPAHQDDLFGHAIMAQEDDPGQESRQKHHAGGDDLPREFTDQTPAKAADQRADQRRKKDDRCHKP